MAIKDIFVNTEGSRPSTFDILLQEADIMYDAHHVAKHSNIPVTVPVSGVVIQVGTDGDSARVMNGKKIDSVV